MGAPRREPSLAAGAAVVALVLTSAIAARAETLGEAMALAYETNPTLQAQRAGQRALDETLVQAQSGYKPTASIQGSISVDTNTVSSPYARAIPGLSQQPFNGRSDTSGASIVLNQPIYTGGRVAAQISAAQAEIYAGREALRASEQDILRNVIRAYIDVRRDQQAVAILEYEVRILHQLQAEMRARRAVGAVTRTDQAQTDSRVAAALAQLAQQRARLDDSRANYASIVGRNPGQLAAEPPLMHVMPRTIDQAFDRAERDSPVLRRAAFTEQSSHAKTAVAKAQGRPTIALQGTYGYTGGTFGALGNPMGNSAHDANAQAVVNVPLFTGGLNSSQVRQAAESENADRIGVEVARRQVLHSVSQAWNALSGARASLGADEAQVSAANLAFEGARQESRVGQRATLDVLLAEQTLAAAQIELISTRHDEYAAAADLLAAEGALNPKDFDPGVQLYDASRNSKRLKTAWPFAPWSAAVAAPDSIGAPKLDDRPVPVRPRP